MTAIAKEAPIAGPEPAPTSSPLAAWIAGIGTVLRQLGPYVAIEILLPGGTLMALLLWLYRRNVYASAQARTSAANRLSAAVSGVGPCGRAHLHSADDRRVPRCPSRHHADTAAG